MKNPFRAPFHPRYLVSIAFMLIAMAAIFLADTVMDYAVAAAGFYTAVILAAVRLLSARSLIMLACACVLLTVVSFYLTQFGSYQVGLINSGISIVAIAITTYLALKMEAAKAAAHQAQAQLLRIARATSLGELTTSIAHEVNQPLAAIVTSANAAQRWLAQEPANLDKARQSVERILSDAHRASEIIARIRSLTKGELPHKSRFDLKQAVLEVLGISRNEIDKHGITLHLDLADDTPWVLADRVQIQQVIVNLLLNASEAMDQHNKRREMTIVLKKQAPASVLFSISDTGPGFSGADLAHLFDAFWTTKSNGIGLGLTISQTIMQTNHGQIWAEANPGGGARFCFTLPAASGTTL